MTIHDSKFRKDTWAMNTRLEATFIGADVELFEVVFDEIERVLRETELLLSCHMPDAFTTKLNHLNAEDVVLFPEEFIEVLQLCKSYYQKTLGMFDVTLGSGETFFNNDTFQIPSGSQRIHQPFHLDFGGFGKGYALRKIDELLDKFDVDNAFIVFGGNSVLSRGNAPMAEEWKYTIKEINNRVFYLNYHGVSISSNASIMGHNNHIVDPISLTPVDANLVTAVKANDVLDAEVLSTALLPARSNQFQTIINAFKGAEVYIADRIEPQNCLHLFAN